MSNFLLPDDRAARDAQIVTLTRAGRSAADIARVLRITKRTVNRVRVRTNTPAPVRRMPMSEGEIHRAMQMLDDGASYGEVARTLGRGHATIRQRLPGRSCWKVGGGNDIREYRKLLNSLTGPVDWEVPA